MVYNPEIKYGPLTKAICSDASWKGQDDFPSNQLWADEVEKVLSFLQVKGQFKNYLPMLRGKLTQRDSALAEARVAFFFHRNGFLILNWQPKGADKRFGEFEIQWPNSESIFVEVKGPRWEGELNDNEKFGLRRQQPRYINAEARWVDPVKKVISAAEKAIPKFLDDKPNLLVVVSYLLFISPRELPRYVVEPQISSALADNKFSKIGGIVLFDTLYRSNSIEYEIIYIKNTAAASQCAIPERVSEGLSSANLKGFRR